jgi:hypothetical protein
MLAAVQWATDVRVNGMPALDDASAKKIFHAPAWNNSRGSGNRSAGLRVWLAHVTDDPIEVAWSWLHHSHGNAIVGDFNRYPRGGNRALVIPDWRGRAQRRVSWECAFDGCRCNCCARGKVSSRRTGHDVEKLLELTYQILQTSTYWAGEHGHGMWETADGAIRFGYGARAALWDRFGSTYRGIGGAQAFQRALTCLAECNQVVGDIHSTRAMTTEDRKKRARPDEVLDARHTAVPLRNVQPWSTYDTMRRIARPVSRARRSIVADFFSGYQSLAPVAHAYGYTYVSIDISAVITAGTREFRATIVQDLTLIPHGEIINWLLERLGVSRKCIAFIWCSPPCRTFTPGDAANAGTSVKRLLPCNFRDHTHAERPPRRPLYHNDRFTALARLHDMLVSSLLASLLMSGLKWVIENPVGSLNRRPYMAGAGQVTESHYCAFRGSYYHKPTHLWNHSMMDMRLQGFNPDCGGKCGGCNDSCNCGHVNQRTGRWNHDNVIAGAKGRRLAGDSGTAVQLKNSVPFELQYAVVQHVLQHNSPTRHPGAA